MAYCTTALVRDVSGIDSDDIRDQKIASLRDNVAIPELNEDLNETVDNEKVEAVSGEKQNDTDGSNKTFYLRKLHKTHKVLGDRSDDGEVDADDVTGYYLDNNDDRNDINVVSVDDADIGELTIEQPGGGALPSDARLFLSYEVAPVDQSTPHSMIKVACAQLTAAYSFTNIEASKFKNYSIGNVTIRKRSQGFSIMKDQYINTRNRILAGDLIEFGENEQNVENVFSQPFNSRKQVSRPGT